MRRSPPLLATVLLFALLAGCGLTEEDARVCEGVTCTAGYCIAVGGQPVCHCGAWEQAVGETCALVRDVPMDTDDSPEGATPLAPSGEPVSSTFAPTWSSLDVDYFVFEASAGHIYRLSCTASATGCYLSLVDAEGRDVAKGGGSPGFAFQVELAQAGRYHVRLVSLSGQAGDYSVRLEDLGLDDFGDHLGAASPRTPSPEWFGGRLETPGDRDFFSFAATAGHMYRLSCISSMQESWTVWLRDGSGQALSEASSYGGKAAVGRKAPGDGLLFAEVSAKDPQGGDYACKLEDLGPDDHGDTLDTATVLTPVTDGSLTPGRIELFGDVDVFTFTPTPGHLYGFVYTYGLSCSLLMQSATGSQHDSHMPFSVIDVPPGSTPFLLLGSRGGDAEYSYRLEDLGVDDHGGTAATATPLVAGTSAAVHVAGLGDVDALTFSATARRVYRLTVSPASIIENVLVSMAGQTLRWGATTTSEPSSLQYTLQPLGDGPVLVQVRGWAAHYQVLLEDTLPPDDGDTLATATPLAVGEARAGRIDVPGDVDLFSLSLEAGRSYELLTSTSDSRVLFGVFDPDGQQELFPESNPKVFTASVTGTYWVRASSNASLHGLDYQFTLQ